MLGSQTHVHRFRWQDRKKKTAEGTTFSSILVPKDPLSKKGTLLFPGLLGNLDVCSSLRNHVPMSHQVSGVKHVDNFEPKEP